MKYKDVGFRKFYNKFAAVPVKDSFRKIMNGFPGINSANYVLTYGYIDHNTGFVFEIVAALVKSEEKFKFAISNLSTSSKIPIGVVIEDEVIVMEDESGGIRKFYKEKVDTLSAYNVRDEIERSRKMEFLDNSRNLEFPDDVSVYLLRDGNKPERCWVRIEDLKGHKILGTLLNEPTQKFDFHIGDTVAFTLRKSNDNLINCVLVC